MNKTLIAEAVATMSPYGGANIRALMSGEYSVATMHAARLELADRIDTLIRRNRRIPHSPDRAKLAATAQAAYDEIAAHLNEMEEL